MMRIHGLQNLSTNSVYFDPGFRVIYDSFRPYLLNSLTETQVKPAVAYKYQGDFYGLLDHIGIVKDHHFFVLITNDLTHSGNYDGLTTTIKLPNFEVIDRLRGLYASGTL